MGYIIPENIDQLNLRILQLISNEYHLDILNDFDIRMTLNQHLVPFDIRMRYEIPLKNPLLQEIKENYSLAYQAARIAANVLSDIYKRPIPEDEIGYFALIFQLALEKQQCKRRSNILIICSSGKVSSQLLKYKYQKEFAEYLDNIWVCDVAALESFNFSQIDFILTTVPITRKVPVPIIEIEHFLDDENKRKVADTLTLNDIGV
ncbi:MAG: BglG family transcription antiterminator [Blautia caecimuris]